MLRHTVLCLFLVFQYTTAIEVDELADRVEDHHDTIDFPAEDRDDWFWDDNFWRYPHMMRLECPDGYGWEGDYNSGGCRACEAGQYSASWGPTFRCITCPPGTFQPNTCSDRCMRCPEWASLSKAGSTNPHDCMAFPDASDGDMTAIVEAMVTVTGDCTFLNEVLNELSSYPAFEMSGNVKYDKEKDSTTGSVRLVMDERAAFEAHMYVQELKTQLPLVNDWIRTGHAYVNRIFSMLNNADILYLMGLKMDPTEIHRQLRNLEVTNIDSKYHKGCKVNQMRLDINDVDEGYPNMGYCKDDPDYTEGDHDMKYFSYTGESEVCKTLGSRTRFHDYIHYEWEVADCGKEGDCSKSLMRCEYDWDTNESWIVVYARKKYGKLDSSAFNDDMKNLADGKGNEFDFVADFSADKCAGGPDSSEDSSCDKPECPEHTQICWATGMCRGCPFGSYWDNVAEECSHCDSVPGHQKDSFISETYEPDMVGPESCIAYYGDHDVMWKSGGSQHFVRLDRRPFDIPRDNRQRYKVDIDAKLDVCFVLYKKAKFDKFCWDKYDDLDELTFDDFTDFDLTKLSCLVMWKIDELYDSNCKDREYSWPHTYQFDRYWLDAACLVVQHVMETDHNMPDGDIERCEEVDVKVRTLSMPFNLQRGLSNDLDWGSTLMPLIMYAHEMPKADFSSVTTAVRGAMKRLGVYETARITGLGMADYVRDLLLETPENLWLTEASAELLNQPEDVYCDNGMVKRDCRSACAIPFNQCMQQVGDDKDLTCKADECNDCKVTYYWDDSGTETEYECVEICQNLLDFESNTFLTMVTACPDVEGDKMFHYDCLPDFRLVNSEIDLANCMDEEPKAYKCNEDSNIEDSPTCVEDKCTLPEEGPENGFIKSVHAYANRACRWVEMACNPGFMLHGNAICYCDGEGNWGDMPECKPVECDGDDSTIENGKLVNHLIGTDMSWYRCDVNNPTYEGETDYFAAKTCGETIVCGKPQDEHCPPRINNGYKVREWEQRLEGTDGRPEGEPRVWNAEYRCEPNYMIQDNEMFKGDAEKHGWSRCVDGEENKMPRCIEVEEEDDGEMKPCKMPEITYNGYLMEEFRDEEGRVTHGRYTCNPGFVMVETIMKDHGFCREYDHSYELPYCVAPEDWARLEFVLVQGYAKKMENAGRVKARHHYHDGRVGDWYAACDDHFNSPAAASMCQQMGFKFGRAIDAPRKMRPIEGVPFGITNFWCYYDDVLPMSAQCHTDDYGQLGWPLCMPEEQVAVSCYDILWKVDVGFTMKSKKQHKMFCPVNVVKEGMKMKVKKMGLRATWGGLKHNPETDEYDYTEFVEGTHFTDRGFSKKKGFRANYIGNVDDYDCFYCNIFLGDHWMNPTSANNHNCGGE